MTTENPLDDIRLACQLFPARFQTLQLGTVAADGQPEASYAPYVTDQGRYYVYLSRLARHAGKSAITDLRLLDSQPEACLVHCKLHTGRTHQIRVHLAHLGHPLVADELYGGRPLAGMSRQALHAWRLSLVHPVTGQALSWRVPLPEDIGQAMHRLGLQGAELE